VLLAYRGLKRDRGALERFAVRSVAKWKGRGSLFQGSPGTV